MARQKRGDFVAIGVDETEMKLKLKLKSKRRKKKTIDYTEAKAESFVKLLQW